MGFIKERRFKRQSPDQHNPTNPTANTNIDTNKYDINEETIKNQQNKK